MGKLLDRFGKYIEKAYVVKGRFNWDKWSFAGLRCTAMVMKFDWDGDYYPTEEMVEDRKRFGFRELIICPDNQVVDVGEDYALQILSGTGTPGAALTNAAAQLGVSSDVTAVAETQNELDIGSNDAEDFQGMEVGYPQSPGQGQMDWRAQWTGAQGNFAWESWGLANGNDPPTTGTLFNRALFAPSPGTKGAGETWTLTVTLSAD